MTADKELPSAFESFMPLIVPIILILLKNVASALGVDLASTVGKAITLLGDPIIAVGAGLLLSIFVLGRNLDRKTVLDEMDAGIKSCGIIILVTGGGGLFFIHQKNRIGTPKVQKKHCF